MVEAAEAVTETHGTKPLRVGLDIGSTTVKAVVLDQSDALADALFYPPGCIPWQAWKPLPRVIQSCNRSLCPRLSAL